MKFKIIQLFISLGFLILLCGAIPAEAQSSITCANVRCAGSCIDTPGGPVCEPQRPTCASTLCAQGNQCVESQSGPQCVPLSGQNYNHYPPQNLSPQYYYNPQSWPRYKREQWRRRAYRNVTPWQSRGYYNRRHYQPPPYYSYHGHNWTPAPLPATPPKNPGHEGIMCPMVYQPVCAQKTVQCVRAPCPPLMKTFGNSCEAGREGYDVIYEGQCR